MPELPEVETVARDLRPIVVGKRISAVERSRFALRVPWRKSWEALLVGKRIDSLDRRGKWLVFRLSADARLLVHLGMSGQLKAMPSGTPTEPHTHLVLSLGKKHQLRYCDIRRFGSARYFANESALQQHFVAIGLGPEPFSADLSAWTTALTSTSRILKGALLDQTLLAGVGNIYADESLFEAKLSPRQTGKATTPEQAARLLQAVVKVLRQAIEKRGSSIRNYVGGEGLKGEYQDEFRVYGRAGLPCYVCGTFLRSERLAGRTSCYCPSCQG